MNTRRWLRLFRGLTLGGVLAWTTLSGAQSGEPQASSPTAPTQPDSTDSIRELQNQVRELQSELQSMTAEMHSAFQQSRTETAELRRELDQVRGGAQPREAVLRQAVVSSQTEVPKEAPQVEAQEQKESAKKGEHAATIEEEYQLLSGKVDDQYQTKVESASKYRLRLSGIVLMNLVSNQGVVDSVDLPTVAYARMAGIPDGSFGATLRQSEIGFRLSARP